MLDGTLTSVDGCLVVRNDGDGDLVVYLPAGDFRAAGSEDFELFGESFSLGDKISLAGGYYRIEDAPLGDDCAAASSKLSAFTASSLGSAP
ncbi:MAG: hypothetical protein LBS27_02220 [Bifidobacteriaceae bacterium]|nr:hypothetical protein [Bifidobacteriaceae bacterium]